MARLPAGMRKKKSGLFEKRFTLNGKRYSAYGRTIKDCSIKEEQMKKEILSGSYTSNKNVILDRYFEEWEKTRDGVVKESSRKTLHHKYKNHIQPILGKKKVCEIEKREIIQLQKTLSEELSATTTNSVIGILKSVLNEAVDDEIIEKNPAINVKPLRTDGEKKAAETIHRALTKEEQQAFLQAAKNEWLYEFYCFSLCTGMRLNEITALKWSDIDQTNNVIHVTKTISWKEGGGISETTPKSQTSKRDIPLNDTIRCVLKQQRDKLAEVYGEIYARQPDNHIFIGKKGAKAIASSTVGYSIRRVLKWMPEEIEYFTHHAFRDTFATRYIEEGGNMQTLKTILGHNSLGMTADLYSHVLPNTKQKEMDQIQNGFIGIAAQ